LHGTACYLVRTRVRRRNLALSRRRRRGEVVDCVQHVCVSWPGENGSSSTMRNTVPIACCKYEDFKRNGVNHCSLTCAKGREGRGSRHLAYTRGTHVQGASQAPKPETGRGLFHFALSGLGSREGIFAGGVVFVRVRPPMMHMRRSPIHLTVDQPQQTRNRRIEER
jgi:hypothetical protein